MTDVDAGLSRRAFLGGGAAGVLTPWGAVGASVEEAGVRASALPHQAPELAKEMVLVAHFSFERVRGLLDLAPDLAKAARDWGFGDWETAIGAASHTGNREIALLLMEHGARPTIFTHAMLGETGVVRAACEARPEIARSAGPHGITLLDHARAGGERARETAAYLDTVEGAGEGPPDAPVSESDRVWCSGRYRYEGAADGATVVIAWGARQGGLMSTHAGHPPQRLRHLGGRVFSPAGAPAVRIEFGGDGGAPAAGRLRITSPAFVAEARRVG